MFNCKYLIKVTAVTLFAKAWVVHASPYVSASVLTTYKSNAQASSSNADLGLFVNLDVGLPLSTKVFAFAKYIFHRTSTIQSDSDAPVTTFASLGGGLGYAQDSMAKFNAKLSVLLFPTETTKGSYSYTQYGAYGGSLDLAYLFKFGSVAVGPQVSAIYSIYKKERTDSDTKDLSDARSQIVVQPYVALWYFF